MDYTSIHPSSVDLAHQVDLHLWRGAPQNLDADRPIEILVNNGYVVGFCPDRLQPAWSAYRVAHADDDVDYDRPLSYYDDMRLPQEQRIGRRTFGKIGGIQLNVGHMAPNEVINRQFGRLAQMETFLMSNMSPQYASLNSGVWLELETAIREIKDEKGKDHVWSVVGPVFGEEPDSINRSYGKYLPIPDAYFCVIVDPHTYPYDTPSRAQIDCFIIPQNAPRAGDPGDYPASLEEVEEATGLKFFEGWGRELPAGALASRVAGKASGQQSESRLMSILNRSAAEKAEEAQARTTTAESIADKSKTIDDLIAALKQEASEVEILGRKLRPEETARLRTIQHTISWLLRAREIARPKKEEADTPTMITYKVASDSGDKLQQGARTACNFWNRFVQPKQSIVIRLGVFTQNSYTIARAYKPYSKGGVRYGRVEFNTKYLSTFADDEIAGTITHEIGHSLGIGWKRWNKLYDRDTGEFTSKAIAELGGLEHMEVELDGGPGTRLSHWDEHLFDKELMTGYQDKGEHVLPVTIDLMEPLGHTVIERLEDKTPLEDLLREAASVVFSRQNEASRLDLEHFKETEIFECIPHEPPPGAG